MFTLAVCLVVAQMVGEGSDVDRIAKRSQTESAADEEQGGNPDGFADDSEIGPEGYPDDVDETAQQVDTGVLPNQPEIEDFSAEETDPASIKGVTRRRARDANGLLIRDNNGLKPGEETNNFDPRLR
jgi:hypothetical protein